MDFISISIPRGKNKSERALPAAGRPVVLEDILSGRRRLCGRQIGNGYGMWQITIYNDKN